MCVHFTLHYRKHAVTEPHEKSLNKTPFYPVALLFFTAICIQEREHLLILSLCRNFISGAILKAEIETYTRSIRARYNFTEM